MTIFSLALRTRPGAGPPHNLITGLPAASFPITTRLHLGVAQGPERNLLDVWLEPEALTLSCQAADDAWHYFRFADSTLKPLPPRPAALAFSPGDAYIAITPGASKIADSPAIARFLHLRDYFNAEKLAEALLAHLVELAGTDEFPEDVTVLVIEAR
jgi:hypothetical protein